MSDSDLLEQLATNRAKIILELWEIVGDSGEDGAPAAARVAALDKIAKIEGAYKPPPVANNNRYRNLADFYADVIVPEPDEESGEEADEDDV